jgi:hypothetical protein
MTTLTKLYAELPELAQATIQRILQECDKSKTTSTFVLDIAAKRVLPVLAKVNPGNELIQCSLVSGKPLDLREMVLNDSPNSRLLFLMPLDWNCAQSRAKVWESLDAHIHHIYPVSTRIDYLKNGIPMSKCQKTINGVPQFDKNGKPIRNSGRQCYDAVFDIRLGKAQSASTLIFKYV